MLFEIDDYIHAVRKMAHARGPRALRQGDAAPRRARACAWPTASSARPTYLARRYGRFNPRTFVCRNGLDLRRYDLERPARDGVVIGWAGGDRAPSRRCSRGSRESRDVMARPARDALRDDRPELRRRLRPRSSAPSAASSVPFTQLETYPAAMTHVRRRARAVGHRTTSSAARATCDGSRRAPSASRSSPTPGVYPELEHGVTGFHAAHAGRDARPPDRRWSTTRRSAPASARPPAPTCAAAAPSR